MARWLASVLDAIFPEACRLCDPTSDAAPWVCDRCIDTSPTAPAITCAACGVEGAAGGADHRGPLVRAATYYGRDQRVAASVALRMLKYDGRRRLARPLAGLLHRRLGPLGNAVLVPVPLHPSRIRERGFNQAGLLARHLGRLAGLPTRPAALRRIRATTAQAHLARAARFENLAGAFAASSRLSTTRPIVLVDDVATTGATLVACANALHGAGIHDVTAIVVARRVLLSAPARTR